MKIAFSNVKTLFEHKAFTDQTTEREAIASLKAGLYAQIACQLTRYLCITASGIFHTGAWPGKRTKKWDIYSEFERKVRLAGDHRLICCEIL